MKYLREIINYGILNSGYPTTLKGYSNANWILDIDESISISGFIFTLGGVL